MGTTSPALSRVTAVAAVRFVSSILWLLNVAHRSERKGVEYTRSRQTRTSSRRSTAACKFASVPQTDYQSNFVISHNTLALRTPGLGLIRLQPFRLGLANQRSVRAAERQPPIQRHHVSTYMPSRPQAAAGKSWALCLLEKSLP